MDAVAGPCGTGPRDFPARADQPAGQRQTLHEQPHSDRGRVPAAGGELAEQAVARQFLVEMEKLRIVALGDSRISSSSITWEALVKR